METDLSESATEHFAVAYEFPNVEWGLQLALYVYVEDESGWVIMVNTTLAAVATATDFLRDVEAGKHEFVVDAVPGATESTYPSKPDRRYAVLVEECGVSEVS